ncbi:MAG: hypothetical protein EXR62_01945 [Chloroflexi bacterium]|nr:hypothetical protein [Chloroflexota bacterium]
MKFRGIFVAVLSSLTFLFLYMVMLGQAGAVQPTASELQLPATPFPTPNDPFYPAQWNLSKLNMMDAWKTTTGNSDIVIAVLGSGIDLNHPDLAAKIWSNPGEISGNGIDDDNNGFADDIHGWNFVGNTSNVQDDHGCGTAVAGVAAAATNNSIGIAGVSWGARIMPVKVLGNNCQPDPTKSYMSQGILYAANNGAKIILTSFWYTSQDFPGALDAAVGYAYRKGALVIAPVGDWSEPDGLIRYPAGLEHVLAVTAVDGQNKASPYIVSGSYVALAAPGLDATGHQGITTTFPVNLGPPYVTAQGAEFAAAEVAGVAALLWSKYPPSKADDIAERMTSTALDLGEPGPDGIYGAGLVNPVAALRSTPECLQLGTSSLYFLSDTGQPPASQYLPLFNSCISSTGWSAEIGAGWLLSDPLTGTTPATLTIGIDLTQVITYGTYTAPITVTTQITDGVVSRQVVPVTLDYRRPLNKLYLPLVTR